MDLAWITISFTLLLSGIAPSTEQKIPKKQTTFV